MWKTSSKLYQKGLLTSKAISTMMSCRYGVLYSRTVDPVGMDVLYSSTVHCVSCRYGVLYSRTVYPVGMDVLYSRTVYPVGMDVL